MLSRVGQTDKGLLPLGEAYNPISYVTGIPATSDYEAVVGHPSDREPERETEEVKSS